SRRERHRHDCRCTIRQTAVQGACRSDGRWGVRDVRRDGSGASRNAASGGTPRFADAGHSEVRLANRTAQDRIAFGVSAPIKRKSSIFWRTLFFWSICLYATVIVWPSLQRCVSELCHIPLEIPGEHRHLRAHREVLRCRGKLIDRTCVGGFWCASARVKRPDFKACSFNHSDISVSSAPERTTSSTTRTRGSSAGSRTTRSPARAARPDDLEELGLASTAAIIAR